MKLIPINDGSNQITEDRRVKVFKCANGWAARLVDDPYPCADGFSTPEAAAEAAYSVLSSRNPNGSST